MDTAFGHCDTGMGFGRAGREPAIDMDSVPRRRATRLGCAPTTS
ncbi:hypothetical protein AZ78_3694 [Lysobacter capsici AZ78]|uniref:Uncharacterized protein n=1 Tax=Lysobacter capsici AZ78 TaxID=1444315 RepID=A0A120AHH1_9GAMM|nr:hypothetical protein AZ78_3694 [Lysobacter capsici AZ78]